MNIIWFYTNRNAESYLSNNYLLFAATQVQPIGATGIRGGRGGGHTDTSLLRRRSLAFHPLLTGIRGGEGGREREGGRGRGGGHTDTSLLRRRSLAFHPLLTGIRGGEREGGRGREGEGGVEDIRTHPFLAGVRWPSLHC